MEIEHRGRPSFDGDGIPAATQPQAGLTTWERRTELERGLRTANLSKEIAAGTRIKKMLTHLFSII